MYPFTFETWNRLFLYLFRLLRKWGLCTTFRKLNFFFLFSKSQDFRGRNSKIQILANLKLKGGNTNYFTFQVHHRATT